MENIKETVASNLKKIMKNRKIKQKDIASSLGLSEGSVSHWLRGDNFIDIENLYQICLHFDISLDQLFGLKTISVIGEEKSIIESYRQSGDETQKVIRKILDIPEPKKDTDQSVI